jgi:GT2 family glycosyltransferase
MIKPISFCINTANNEKDYVLLLLKSLKEHTQIDIHEVLVFVDTDNQNTYEALIDYKKELPNLRVTKNHSPYPVWSQKNVSILFDGAVNDIVCYLQSDMVVGKDFDKHISLNLSSEKTVLCCARIEPPLHPESPEKIVMNFGMSPEEFRYDDFNSFVNELQKENRPNIWGHFAPFALYKKTWVNILGGFDSQFRCSREDSDLIIRMGATGLDLVQSWNACVYHFTCISSRGNDWFKQNNISKKKNTLQEKADQEELKRFIRKWGYFGHDYKPKYNSTLLINIDTGVDINIIKSIEPYFSKIVLNDLDVAQELKHQLDFENYYYANKRWGYTSKHWDEVKHDFNIVDFDKRIEYCSDLDSYVDGDIIIKTSFYDLMTNISSQEMYSFISKSNEIFNNMSQQDSYVGDYQIGDFLIKINNLEDVNMENLNPKPYQINNVDNFKFI